MQLQSYGQLQGPTRNKSITTEIIGFNIKLVGFRIVVNMSLESVPTWFADYTGISLEAAQVILSIVVLAAVLFPALYLAKGHKLAITIFLFLTEIFLVGIGWLSFWVLVATIAVMAMAVALMGKNIVAG